MYCTNAQIICKLVKRRATAPAAARQGRNIAWQHKTRDVEVAEVPAGHSVLIPM